MQIFFFRYCTQFLIDPELRKTFADQKTKLPYLSLLMEKSVVDENRSGVTATPPGHPGKGL